MRLMVEVLKHIASISLIKSHQGYPIHSNYVYKRRETSSLLPLSSPSFNQSNCLSTEMPSFRSFTSTRSERVRRRREEILEEFSTEGWQQKDRIRTSEGEAQ